MLWSVSLFVLLIYLYVAIYLKDAHRDDIMFKEYNFQKPTDENVAKEEVKYSVKCLKKMNKMSAYKR